MKKTQWIELFHRIKETMVSFLAILFFVMFGIALFIGTGWSKYAVEDSLEREFKQYSFHNYEVISNYSFTEENIEELSDKLDSYTFEGSYSTFAYFNFNNRKLHAKIVGLTNDIDKLFLLEGQLPQVEDEIVIENSWAKRSKIEIGDYISFSNDNSTLKNTEYRVCGFADSPAYISNRAPNYEVSTSGGSATSCVMFVSKEAFNQVLLPGYNELFIKTEALDEYKTMSNEYIEESNKIKATIEKELSEIIDKDYSILTRNDNGSVFAASILSDLFNKLKYNFACMFIVIGFMICYSTVSRLVFIDIKRIGTKKALGFSPKEISKSYLFYILIVTSLGCVLGVLLGRLFIEPYFVKILSNTFIFEKAIYSFSLKEFLILCITELVVMVTICLLSCKSVLNRNLVTLLEGYEIPEMKPTIFEKSKLWKKLSLFTKSIINNLIYDKRRVIATLIGITGCTALIVCALSFEVSITGTTKKHFELQKYNYTISYDYRIDSAETDIENYLSENGYSYEKASFNNITLIKKDGDAVVSRLLVGYDNDFNNLITFNSNGNKELPVNGVWLSIGYAKENGYKAGDYIEILDSNSIVHEEKIGGIFEYYQQVPYLVMSEDTYKQVFNKAPLFNVYLVSSTEDTNTFKDNLSGIKEVIGVKSEMDAYMSTQSTINTVATAIVVIYIVLSIVIALCVVLDLFILFIEERKKELIVLMINGYSNSSAKKYIYTDTLLLSIVGIVLGALIGTLMCQWTISSISSDMSYYMHGFNLGICIASCAISAILILLMCLISLKKIDKFELSDINK